MVKPPDISRETLTKMPNHKLYFGEAIEDSVSTKAKGVDADSGRENLWTPAWTTSPELLMDSGWGQTRMHVDWDIKVLHSFPEYVILVAVIMEHSIAIGPAGLP
jgi:hypothetical protein